MNEFCNKNNISLGNTCLFRLNDEFTWQRKTYFGCRKTPCSMGYGLQRLLDRVKKVTDGRWYANKLWRIIQKSKMIEPKMTLVSRNSRISYVVVLPWHWTTVTHKIICKHISDGVSSSSSLLATNICNSFEFIAVNIVMTSVSVSCSNKIMQHATGFNNRNC